VGAEDEVVACASPLLLARLAVGALVQLSRAARVSGLPGRVLVKQVDKEIVGELARTLGEDTVGGAIVAPRARIPPTRTVISGAVSLSK
jgi:hypothetical protein